MKLINSVFNKLVESTKIITSHPLIIFTVYAVTFFIYRDFGVRMVLGYGLMIMLVGLIFLEKIHSKSRIIFSNIQMAYLIYVATVLLNFLRPGSNHNNANIVYIIMMVLSTITILLSQHNCSEIRPMMKIFAVTGTLFSLFILFFQIFRKLYWKLIFPLLSETASVYAKRYFFKGYSVSIGGFTYTDYIIVFGFICIVSYLLYHKNTKQRKVFLYILLTILSFSMILVGRRGEVVAFVVSLGVFYIATGGKGKRIKRTGILLGSIFALLVIFILLIPFLENIKFLHRYTMTIKALFLGGKVNGGVTSGRVELYSAAWKLFLERPLFGIGWGNFSVYASNVMGYSPDLPMDVHNIVLQLLAETGLFGTVFILSPVVYLNVTTFNQTSRLWMRKKKEKINPYLLSANTISLLFQTFILVVALFDPSNYKTIYWVFFFIAIYLQVCSDKLEGVRKYSCFNQVKSLFTTKTLN